MIDFTNTTLIVCQYNTPYLIEPFLKSFVYYHPEVKKFNILVSGEAVVMGKATVQGTNVASTEKLNTYTFSGGSYVRSDTSLSAKYRYSLPPQDVQVKLLITLKNPLYYRNILTYRNGSV